MQQAPWRHVISLKRGSSESDCGEVGLGLCEASPETDHRSLDSASLRHIETLYHLRRQLQIGKGHSWQFLDHP